MKCFAVTKGINMSNRTYRYNYGNYCGAEVQYYGLYNQGETSYLNSVLQVLFRTEDFRAAVESHCHENTAGGNCLDCRLQSLFDELKWRTAETHSITKCLGIDRVNVQRDAAEYFEKILSLTSSHVSQVFRGLLTNSIICSCGTETDSDGPFWNLPLELVDSDSELYSVVNGIEDYFRQKHFRGENQLYCDSCHAKYDAVTKRVIKNHPEVLMLLLKRFKINSDVIVPDTLHIPENQKYELYAVVDHFGSLRGGHYTATINVNGEWYTFNDSSVTKTRPVNIISSSAYLLFYKKTKVHTAVQRTQNLREVSTTGNFPTPKTGICVTDDRNDSPETVRMTNDKNRFNDRFSPELCRDVDYQRSDPQQQEEWYDCFNYLEAEKQKDESKVRKDEEDVRGNSEAANQAEKRETSLAAAQIQELYCAQDAGIQEASEQRRGHDKRSQSKERLERQHQYEGHLSKQNNGGSDDSREEKSEQTVSATHKKHEAVDEEIKTEVRRVKSSMRRTEAAGSRRVNPGCGREEKLIQVEVSPVLNENSEDRRHGLWRERFLSPRKLPLKLQKTSVTTSHHKHKDKRQTSTVKALVVSPNVQEMTGNFSNRHATRGRTGKVSQSGRVLHGLYNQGATCYLNCVLQVLFMTKEIHDRLTETQTDHVLRKLFNDLQNKTCRTEAITRCLSISDVKEQRDAARCLMQILRDISKEASKVFQGRMRCITTCCQKHSIHLESKRFSIFPLSLKHGPDGTYCVEKSFQRFFQPEAFTGNNNLFCNKCGNKTAAETRPHMSKCPPILTLLLKALSDVKSKCPVKVPRSLELGNKTYELYGIVDHTGSLRGGHYTATILSSEDNTWYQFNDEHVSKVPEQPFAQEEYYNSQNAYLLMYSALRSRRNTAALSSNVGQIQQVIVSTPGGEKKIINLCNTEEEMQKMTVLQLKEKITEEIPEYSEDILQVVFERILEDDETLGSCEIQHMSTIDVVLKVRGGGRFPPAPRPPRRQSIELFMSF